ncbi:hypothetical protein P6144_18390 [Sphingomonas sp. HITSZ_GF]|uniref:hypothetical protein n=1 Tax=Sphingomonas sp. HITSZ_GF TaxID=3037247 RepID=UPI00240CFBC5|nr:hypothetical protein [Sphingomonas sp. HITSZ_GF]MDG2535637.1 hypothetical protein [Sphingomonas sp. HITSZ_GF]
MRHINRNDWLNLAGGFLFIYGVIAFFCAFGLEIWWSSTAPSLADPVRGLVVPHREHGLLRYYSAFQSTTSALLFMTSIPLALIGIMLSPKQNLHRRGGKVRWDHDDPRGLHRVGRRAGAVAAPILLFAIGPALVHALNAAGIVIPF